MGVLQDAIGDAGAGLFVSVYLDDSHETEDAAQQRELRWRAARTELDRQGVGADDLDTVERAVLSDAPPAGRGGRAVICSGGRLVVDETLPEPPNLIARASDLPFLLPLCQLAERPVPYVAVVADRIGAELYAIDHSGEPVAPQSVTGRRHPLHKAGGGGPAHYRLQHHTEETVRRNAQDVAERVSKLVHQVGARLLVIAGEAQTRAALRAELPARCLDIATELTSGPAGGEPDLAEYQPEIDRLLAEHRTADRAATLDRFTRQLARDEDAVAGLPGVAAALREGQVSTLLVADTFAGDTTVLVGPDVTQVATTRADLPDVEDQPRERRADEALPAAAVATGADVVVVEPTPRLQDGVGALLRYTHRLSS